MRRGRDSIQPLDLCFRERSGRSSCLPVRPSVHGIFPRCQLADCAHHRLIHQEPGRGLIAVAAEVRLKPGPNGIAGTGKPLTAFPLCSPPESQLISHASIRGQRRVGLRKTRRVPVTPAPRHSMRPHRRSRQRAAGWTPRRAQRTRCTRMRIAGLGPARLMLPKRANRLQRCAGGLDRGTVRGRLGDQCLRQTR